MSAMKNEAIKQLNEEDSIIKPKYSVIGILSYTELHVIGICNTEKEVCILVKNNFGNCIVIDLETGQESTKIWQE